MAKKAPQLLSGVAETLLITLYIRALESQRPDALIKDETAVALFRKIDREGLYDFERTKSLLRRLGPVALLSSVATAFEFYALGHLLERYVRQVRPAGTIRIQEREAALVRQSIDAAVLRVLSPAIGPRPLRVDHPPEDLRDQFTRWLDTLLSTGASLPSYLERRLEAAFDQVLAESPDIGRR